VSGTWSTDACQDVQGAQALECHTPGQDKGFQEASQGESPTGHVPGPDRGFQEESQGESLTGHVPGPDRGLQEESQGDWPAPNVVSKMYVCWHIDY